jgi:hypothetical protein
MGTTNRQQARADRRRETGETIHGFVESMLKRTSKPYAEIAAEARKRFKGANTSPASVRHYASKMRAAKVKIKERPAAREAAFA